MPAAAAPWGRIRFRNLGPPERPRHDPRLRLARAAGRHRAAEGADGLGAHRRGSPSPTASTPTSAWTSGTATTCLYRDDRTGSSAPTSSTTAATRRWGPSGATSISTRARHARRTWEDSPGGLPADRRRTSGGTGTRRPSGQPGLLRRGTGLHDGKAASEHRPLSVAGR